MSERDKLKLLKDFIAAWNSHDIDKLMDCMAVNCVYLAACTGYEGQRYEGFEAVRGLTQKFSIDFPMVHGETVRIE